MNNILITIKKELRTSLRDKRSLIIMLLMPLLIPSIIIGMSAMENYMYEDIKNDIYKIGTNYQLNIDEQEIIKNFQLEYETKNTKEQLIESFNNDEIDAFIYRENDIYTIYFNKQGEDSSYAAKTINDFLTAYNTFLGQQYLINNNIDLENVYSNIKIETANLDGEDTVQTALILLGFMYSIMVITSVAINSATDITAGEKERGTLETILTFPVERSSIVIGKFISVSIMCIFTSVVAIMLSYGSLLVSIKLFTILEGMTLNISISSLLLSLMIMIVYSFLISSITIALASYSKTYKEAQSSLAFLNFIAMIPVIFVLIDISLPNLIYFMPIVNLSIILNQIVTGAATITNVLIVFISSFIYIAITIYFISKLYKNEKILFAN